MKKKVLSKEHCDSFREGTYSTPDGWNGTTELEQGKTALASKRNSGVPGCVVWAMELDEQDHRLIYGRWHTRIGIIGNADSCIVNIQLSRYIVRGFIGEAAPPIPSTPRIVKMLFSDEANVVRVGSTFLNDKPIYLTSETLTSKFIPDLTDPNRTLSLILITTDEESKLPVRNLKNLTKQLFGMADIYVLDWHDRALMDTYREVFLKNTPAYDYGMECSSLKIYCKPVDLTVPTDNEMGMTYAKYLIDRHTRHGDNRFINVLRQGICRASDRVAGDILSIADVRWLDGIDEAKRLSSRIKKLKQRAKGDSGGNETVDSLHDEISGLQKDIADWEEIASELETSNSEAAAKIDMLTRDAMRLENEKRAVERKLEMTELEQLNSNAMNGIRKALGILMIVYSTWCWKLEPKCKVSSKMLSRMVLFSISVVALEFGAVLFYSTLSATDQKSISIERAFQAMREDGAVSGTAVLTDIDPGCRAELNGFKPYLDTRIEVFNGQNGQKNVLAEAGKALSSGSLSAICDDYGMDYAVLNYGINDVGIQDLKESGFKPVYSDNLTVCLKRSTV